MAAVVALVASSLPAGASSAPAAPAWVRLGSAPEVPAGASALGPLDASLPVALDLALRPRDPAGLAALATAVAQPGSPEYHRYLAAGQAARRFGPTAATVAATEAALRRLGLRVASVSPDGLVVHVTATAAAAERAFSTTLERYRLADGRTGFADTTAPRVPATLAAAVESIAGLDTLARPGTDLVRRPGPRRPHPVAAGPAPALRPGDGPAVTGCEVTAQATAGQAAWTPADLAAAYGLDGAYAAGDLGAGTTVAVFELDADAQSDIATWEDCFEGSPTATTVDYEAVDGGQGLGAGTNYGAGEADLDIETIAGLAPAATILVYQGADPSTLSAYTVDALDVIDRIVSDDTARVVSISYGLCEAEADAAAPGFLAAESNEFEMAATQGQSVLAASGDAGSADCSAVDQSLALSVSDPASQPYVTGVGGTSLETADGSDPVTPETDGLVESGWNDAEEPFSGGGGGGGGVSGAWAMPAYQSRSPAGLGVVNVDSSGTPCALASGLCREVPDVSASADQDWGYLVDNDYPDLGVSVIGGTSGATPLWAAIVALGDASPACRANGPLGFLNPGLYAVAGGAAGYGEAFSDIRAVSTADGRIWLNDNDATGSNGGLYPVTAAYDMATGIGGPRAWNSAGTGLLQQLCGPVPGGSTSNPPAVLAARVTLAAPRAAVSPGGTAAVTVVCAPGGAGVCRVRVTLRARATTRTASGLVRRHALLGTATRTTGGGRTVVHVRLDRAGRALLAARGRRVTRVSVTLTVGAGTGEVGTVVLVPRR